MVFWGVKWGSMGSMWFAEVQSGSQGFFEVHLGSVRFNDGFLGLNGVYGFNVVRWVQSGSQGFFEVHLGSVRFNVFLGG